MSDKVKRILTVCTGNTCRSPMAQAILEDLLRKNNRDDIQVESRGIYAMPGDPASKNAIEVCANHGLDLSGHRAEQLTPQDVKSADTIYVMSESHKNAILSVVSVLPDKIKVLGVSDPFGLDVKEYEKCFGQILDYFTEEYENGRLD